MAEVAARQGESGHDSVPISWFARTIRSEIARLEWRGVEDFSPRRWIARAKRRVMNLLRLNLYVDSCALHWGPQAATRLGSRTRETKTANRRCRYEGSTGSLQKITAA